MEMTNILHDKFRANARGYAVRIAEVRPRADGGADLVAESSKNGVSPVNKEFVDAYSPAPGGLLIFFEDGPKLFAQVDTVPEGHRITML